MNVQRWFICLHSTQKLNRGVRHSLAMCANQCSVKHHVTHTLGGRTEPPTNTRHSLAGCPSVSTLPRIQTQGLWVVSWALALHFMCVYAHLSSLHPWVNLRASWLGWKLDAIALYFDSCVFCRFFVCMFVCRFGSGCEVWVHTCVNVSWCVRGEFLTWMCHAAKH